jgi:hypothetical protein
MPWLAAMLGNLVATSLGFWIFSAATSLGVGLVAYNFAFQPAMDRIQSAVGGMPADAVAWFAYLNCDKFLTIVFSAYVVAGAASALRLRKVGA